MLSRVASWLLRVVVATWRVHTHGREAITGPVVYAFLHGDLLPLTLIHRDEGVVGMVSRSRDGERLSAILGHLGYRTVRGSSSRGGARAALEASREGGSVAIAVDGPRGPAGVPKPGAAWIAAERGVPMMAVAVACPMSWRLSTWDGFRIPFPFARLDVTYVSVDPQDSDGLVRALRVDSAP